MHARADRLHKKRLFLALDKFKDVFGPEKLKGWISDIVKLVSPRSIRIYANMTNGKEDSKSGTSYTKSDGDKLIWSSHNNSICDRVFGRTFFAGLDLTIFEKEQEKRAQISPKTNISDLEEDEPPVERGIDDYGDRPTPLRAQMSLVNERR